MLLSGSTSRWKVPFVNYPEHYFMIWDDVRGAIDRCLRRGDLILRDDVELFERSLAGSLGRRHAIGLNSCTDALWFSLKAFDLPANAEVIVPAHTFVASVSAVIHAGLKPVLVDVGEDMVMDVEALKSAIRAKTRVVMPVHLNGHCCDMKAIREIVGDANKRYSHKIFIVEDAAQALGAKVDDQLAGSFGDVAAFSFYPAKILGAAGDAGALVTNHDVVAQRVELLRNHGISPNYKSVIWGLGYNSRLDNIQAAILTAKLKYLRRWIDRRRQIADMYSAGLEDLDLVLPVYGDRFFDVYQNYVIRTNQRDRLESFLRDSGVETMVSWRIPLHRQTSLFKHIGHYHLPVTDDVSDTCLSLPMYPELTDRQVEYVVEKVCECLG